MEPYLHYPTALDWIEHAASWLAFSYIGWQARGWWQHRQAQRADCDGSGTCPAVMHVPGCYRDKLAR